MFSQSFPDVEHLSFEVSSSRCNMAVSSLDVGIEKSQDEMEPNLKYCTDFKVRVFAVNSNNRPPTEVAFLTGISMEAEAELEDVEDFYMLCDMVSDDLLQMAEAVTNHAGSVKKSICPPERNIMYIHYMYVEEAYRGAGIGRYLLDNINDLFCHALNYAHHVCVLKPYPQIKSGDHCLEAQENATPEEVERLIGFYKKAGYRFIRGTDHMYKTQSV